MGNDRIIWIIILVGLIFYVASAKAEETSNPDEYVDDEDNDDYEDPSHAAQISITSAPKILEVDQGQTIQLPCRGEHLQSVIWRKGSEILVAGELVLTNDKRFALSKTDLIIKNVTGNDTGDFRCTAATSKDVDVSHTLRVFDKPRVFVKSPNFVAKDGEPVTLSCDVTGIPEPTVTWERKGKKMPSGEITTEGSELTFASVSRHHSGVYECIGQNSLGSSRTAINLVVTHAPEIEVEKESVHSKQGLDAELVCIVHSEPKAEVDWYKDGRPLNYSKHINEQKQKHYWILHLKNVEQSDFGNYSCVAKNTIGRSHKNVYLTEAPGQPVLKEEYLGNDHVSYTVVYSLESVFPVDESKIKFRKSGDDWQDIVPHPPAEKTTGHVYNLIYTFKDLKQSSDYEVTVTAHNQYGWSLESRPRKFHINGDYRSYDAEIKPGAKEAIGTGSASGRLMPASSLLLSQVFFALLVALSLTWRREFAI